MKVLMWILCIATIIIMVLTALFYLNCEIDLKYAYDLKMGRKDAEFLMHRTETEWLASCAKVLFIYESLVLFFVIKSLIGKKW